MQSDSDIDEAHRMDRAMESVWNSLEVGRECPTFSYRVTSDVVERYRAAIGRPQVVPGTEDWVPPDLFCGDYGPLTEEFGQTIGFHARQTLTSYEPLRIGEEVSTGGTITDKFKRRGYRYYVLEYTHRNHRQDPICRSVATIAVGVLRDPSAGGEEPAEESPGAIPARRPDASTSWQDLGEMVITQDDMDLFAAQGPIRWNWEHHGGGAHTDEAFAKAAGLATTNAQSLHYVGWAGSIFAERQGTRWWHQGGFDFKFVRQVGPGTSLRLQSSAVEDSGGGELARVVLAGTADVVAAGSLAQRTGSR